MSNRKIIRFLVLGILVLLGVHFFLSFRGVGNTFLPRQTLLDMPARRNAISRIVIARSDASVFVLDSAIGDSWCITRPYTALADNRAVMRLQDALMLSPIHSVYREQELLDFGRTRDDYGLDEPRVRVTVSVGDEERVIAFGTTTATGDGVFATREGDASIYVVAKDVFEAVNVPADGFRLRAICPRGVASVDGFLLKRAGSVSSFRLRDGAWSKSRVGEDGAGEPASVTNVRDLFARLATAQVVDFVWPTGAVNEPELATAPLLAQYGLDAESSVTLTLQRPNLTDRDQISFGKPATNGLVYALIQNGRAIATVDGELSEFVSSTDFADPRLFPFEEPVITRFTVGDEMVTCRLSKGMDGGWSLEEPVSAPADRTKVEELLSRLLTLAVSNRVEKGIAVSVQTNGTTEIVARDALLGDFSLPDLRSLDILSISASDIRRVTLTPSSAEKPTSVVYDKDLLCWKIEASDKSGVVSVPAVEKLLEALNPLTAEKIVLLKAATADLRRYGLEEPRYTLSVDPVQGGNLRRVLLIGKAAQGGRFATLVGASESVFILSDETVARLTAPLVTDSIHTKGLP